MKKSKKMIETFMTKQVAIKTLANLKGGDDYRRLKTISDFGLEKMVPLEEEPFDLNP